MKKLLPILLTLFPASAWAGMDSCEQALDAGNAAAAVSAGQQAVKGERDLREAYLCLGRAQEELGRFDEALSALQAAEKLAQQPQDRMMALTLQGNVLRSAHKYAEAVELYRRSLEIALAEKHTVFERIDRNQMGSALQEGGDAKAALEQFQQGLKVAANDNERADSHGRIAAAQSLLGQHDKAIEHQLKSVLYEEKAGDFNHYANAMLELGRICLIGKQYADAEKWLNKFLGTIAEAGDSYWQARTRFLLAQVKSAKGEGSAAKDQWLQAKAMAERIGARQLLAEIVQSEPAM